MKHLIVLLTFFAAHSASAAVVCKTLPQILNVEDDQCQAIEEAAEDCFALLVKASADLRFVAKSDYSKLNQNLLVIMSVRLRIGFIILDIFPALAKAVPALTKLEASRFTLKR